MGRVSKRFTKSMSFNARGVAEMIRDPSQKQLPDQRSCWIRVSAEVRVGDGLPGRVGHDERSLKLADGPGCGEAAGCHPSHTRLIAGLSGFFTLNHVLVRSER